MLQHVAPRLRHSWQKCVFCGAIKPHTRHFWSLNKNIHIFWPKARHSQQEKPVCFNHFLALTLMFSIFKNKKKQKKNTWPFHGLFGLHPNFFFDLHLDLNVIWDPKKFNLNILKFILGIFVWIIRSFESNALIRREKFQAWEICSNLTQIAWFYRVRTSPTEHVPSLTRFCRRHTDWASASSPLFSCFLLCQMATNTLMACWGPSDPQNFIFFSGWKWWVGSQSRTVHLEISSHSDACTNRQSRRWMTALFRNPSLNKWAEGQSSSWG